MFKFHNPELGEFLCPHSLGLPDAPKSFLLPNCVGRLCVDLLNGLLPGAESSYFFGRWNGCALKAERKRSNELAKENQSIDISIIVLNSLRALPQFRKLVPNPNLTLSLPCQHMLLRQGGWRYLEDDGDQLPMDALKVPYAFGGWTTPPKSEDRSSQASKFLTDLSFRLTKNTSSISEAFWIEARGEKDVYSTTGLLKLSDGVNAVEITVNREGREMAFLLRLDARKGSCLAELTDSLGLKYQHKRHVAVPYWG